MRHETLSAETKKLDERGRCPECKIKPMVYKRPKHRLWCSQCFRSYDPETGVQMENWHWKFIPNTGKWFIPETGPVILWKLNGSGRWQETSQEERKAMATKAGIK